MTAPIERQPLRVGMVGLITIGGASEGTAGGVETAVEELSANLAARGHEVHVFVRRRYNRDALKQHRGAILHDLPAIYTKHLESVSHSFLSTLAAIPRCDIIHFHAMGPSLYAWIPRLFGKKTIVTVQGLDWRRAKWGPIARFVLKVAERTSIWFPTRTAVVSRFLEKYYSERYRKPVKYIPNGMPVIEQREFGALARFGLKPNRYILYLSRIVPEKGSHYLVEAFRKVKTDMKLAIVGDARHMDEYLNRVKALACGDDRIVFTGPLYGAEKEEAYSNAYVFCHPSDLEGLPLVLLEAMGNGRCALVSDIPELVEVVEPARLGYTVASGIEAPYGRTFRQGNPDDLAAQLQHLIDTPEEAAQLGKRAQAHVRVEYGWERITDDFEALYRDALGRNRE